jgi:hypothetical protein
MGRIHTCIDERICRVEGVGVLLGFIQIHWFLFIFLLLELTTIFYKARNGQTGAHFNIAAHILYKINNLINKTNGAVCMVSIIRKKKSIDGIFFDQVNHIFM